MKAQRKWVERPSIHIDAPISYKNKLLQIMARVNANTSPTDLARVNGAWKSLRDCDNFKGTPGEGRRFLEAIYATPEWRNFHKFRTKKWKQTPTYKEQARAYAKRRYHSTVKAQREIPEVKQARNDRRRTRYNEGRDSLWTFLTLYRNTAVEPSQLYELYCSWLQKCGLQKTYTLRAMNEALKYKGLTKADNGAWIVQEVTP